MREHFRALYWRPAESEIWKSLSRWTLNIGKGPNSSTRLINWDLWERTHPPSFASGLFSGNLTCDVCLFKSCRKAQRSVQLVMVESSQKKVFPWVQTQTSKYYEQIHMHSYAANWGSRGLNVTESDSKSKGHGFESRYRQGFKLGVVNVLRPLPPSIPQLRRAPWARPHRRSKNVCPLRRVCVYGMCVCSLLIAVWVCTWKGEMQSTNAEYGIPWATRHILSTFPNCELGGISSSPIFCPYNESHWIAKLHWTLLTFILWTQYTETYFKIMIYINISVPQKNRTGLNWHDGV